MKLIGAARDQTRGSSTCAFPDHKPLSGYQYGCRCLRCHAAHIEYHRRYDDVRRPRLDAPKYWRSTRRYGPPRRYAPWHTRRQYPDAKGYMVVTIWGLPHPLNRSNCGGVVLVHRLVLWDKLRGEDAPCYWCGTPLTWLVDLHADHLDNDKTNNDPSNIVPACIRCNGSKADRDRPRHVMW